MGKAETVEKYIDEFLKGKTDEQRAKFMAKDLRKQYSSIMQWRSKERRAKNPAPSGVEIVQTLAKMRQAIVASKDITDAECKSIRAEIDQLSVAIKTYEDEQRQRRIRELEEKKEEITRELQRLRGNEPGLFDSLAEEGESMF